MDEEEIVSGTPIAGSPEVRSVIGSPLGIADVTAPAANDSDVDFDEMERELTHGRFNPLTDLFE